jgi:hypothetical protein
MAQPVSQPAVCSNGLNGFGLKGQCSINIVFKKKIAFVLRVVVARLLFIVGGRSLFV